MAVAEIAEVLLQQRDVAPEQAFGLGPFGMDLHMKPRVVAGERQFEAAQLLGAEGNLDAAVPGLADAVDDLAAKGLGRAASRLPAAGCVEGCGDPSVASRRVRDGARLAGRPVGQG